MYLQTINKIEDKQQEMQKEKLKAKQIFVVVECFYFERNDKKNNIVSERAFDGDDAGIAADFLIIFSSSGFSSSRWL